MNAVILAAVLTVGVNYGWKPLPEGGYEYIVQLTPQNLESLKNGQDSFSDLPPAVRGVRSIRITVGTGEVERSGTPPPAEVPPASPVASPPKKLEPYPAGRPMIAEQNAAFVRDLVPETGPSHAPQPKENEPKKPWVPLTLAMAALLGSLSGNVYLCWLTWETRARYRRLLRTSASDHPMPDCLDLPDDGDPLQDLEQ